MTGNTIRLTGAVDRADPDPAMPTNPFRQHIGWIRAEWTGEYGEKFARLGGLIRDSSTAASSGTSWGASMLAIVWVGDPPPPDVATAAYDWMVDRGPARGERTAYLRVQQRSESASSYQVIT